MKALKSLKSDADITILPADKGNAIVLIDTEDYVVQDHELLDDNNVYEKLDTKIDHIRMLRGKVITKLKNLHKAKRLNIEEWKALRPNEGAIPRFYGLPKVHKTGIPPRPIVSNCNAPNSTIPMQGHPATTTEQYNYQQQRTEILREGEGLDPPKR